MPRFVMVPIFQQTGLLRKTCTAANQLTLCRSSHFVLDAALGPRIDEQCVTAIAFGTTPPQRCFSLVSDTIP